MMNMKKTVTWCIMLLFLFVWSCVGCTQSEFVPSIPLPWRCAFVMTKDNQILSGTVSRELPTCYEFQLSQPEFIAGWTVKQHNGTTSLRFHEMERQWEGNLPSTSIFCVLSTAMDQLCDQTLMIDYQDDGKYVYRGYSGGEEFLITYDLAMDRPILLETQSGWRVQLIYE